MIRGCERDEDRTRGQGNESDAGKSFLDANEAQAAKVHPGQTCQEITAAGENQIDARAGDPHPVVRGIREGGRAATDHWGRFAGQITDVRSAAR